MTPQPIDLDAEAIQFEGHWYTRDELARKIKSMLDSGDFAIGKASAALEQLNQTVAQLRTLAFRVTPEMADAINTISAKHGRGVGSLIREALAMHLGLPPTPDAERGPSSTSKRPSAPTGRRQTEPELSLPITTAPATPPPPPPAAMAAPLLSPPLPPDLKATQQMTMPPQVIAGPGALKVSGPYPAVPPPPPAAAIQSPTIIVEKSALEPVTALEPITTPPTAPKGREDESIQGWFDRS
jgi:hypothetical protein